MAFRYQAPFDPAREFEALTTFRAGGIWHQKGSDFPNDAVDPRVLRMLFDHHKIGFKGDQHRLDFRSLVRRPVGRRWAEPTLETAQGAPTRRERGVQTERPISNPNRRRRARGGGGPAPEAGEAPAPPAPVPVEAAPPDPLDHDGDGEKGGSAKGEESTAAKGARNRRADKIAGLVKDNDKPTLQALAENLEGFTRALTKTQLAELIVGPADGPSGR